MHHGQVSDATGRLLAALSVPTAPRPQPPGPLKALFLPFLYSALYMSFLRPLLNYSKLSFHLVLPHPSAAPRTCISFRPCHL